MGLIGDIVAWRRRAASGLTDGVIRLDRPTKADIEPIRAMRGSMPVPLRRELEAAARTHATGSRSRLFVVRAETNGRVLGYLRIQPSSLDPDVAIVSGFGGPIPERDVWSRRAGGILLEVARSLGYRVIEAEFSAVCPAMLLARSLGFVPAARRDGRRVYRFELARPPTA